MSIKKSWPDEITVRVKAYNEEICDNHIMKIPIPQAMGFELHAENFIL